MAIVADYSAGKPGAKALKAAGFSGAVRYIGFFDLRDSRTPKCTTKAELDDFTANDLGMALVFESRADDWRGGYAAGFNNYKLARAHANMIGFPSTRPIYMAVDSEVIGNVNHAQMADYMTGARDAAGGPHLVGVYGQYSVCQYLWAKGGICDWYWQCRAWSGTPIQYFGPRHLFQHVGLVNAGPIPCDVNDVNQADWGQHLEADSMTYEQFLEYLQRAFKFDLRPDGTGKPGNTWQNGATVFELLGSILNKPVAAPVVISPEDLAKITEAIVARIPNAPSAEQVAQAVVAEFKKAGN